MANSGVVWIDWVFNQCVYMLVWLANFLGVSYEAVNILMFLVAWPLVTLMLIGMLVYQYSIIKAARKVNNNV